MRFTINFSLHKTLCATYESASLRRFSDGRVDSIRASHMPALNWVKDMNDEKATKEEKLRKFHLAIQEQTR